MNKVFDYVGQLINWIHFTKIGFIDILEIIIIAFILYELMLLLKDTRAWSLVKGLVVLLIFLLIAILLDMQTILSIAKGIFSVLVITIVIIFQPELRKALEKLGEKKILKTILPISIDNTIVEGVRFSDKIKEEIVDAVLDMSKSKTGALIVIKKDYSLYDYEKTGIKIDAIITKQLLVNIFKYNTPLHDGAVVIRKGRLKAATCYLPLSKNLNISKEYGTRHRAALGLSEVTDALVIIVSEETGQISIACGGKIDKDITKQQLKKELKKVQTIEKEKIVTRGKVQNEA